VKSSHRRAGEPANHLSRLTQLRDGSLVRLKATSGRDIRARIGGNSFFRFQKNEGIIQTKEFKLQEE